ncbi:neurofilament medium polypeptide-like [Octopus vulgaris]|uniref:Neurofilament medium polypeptide-like n=1 Tax=Octopus vulgaris TaxID=6645 RepID=A0AA36F837_OCTVU|nr:neurofilament medium polypeptide-like [Octopus vulgaris]
MTTVTQKKTEITTSSTSYEDGKSHPRSGGYMYTSKIVPRGSVTTRTSRSSGNVSSGLFHSYDFSAAMPVSGAFNLTSTSVHNVKANREREKQDLRDLNERFANYIEKVRFLEAQNKKLAGELEELKSKWGKETSAIKEMYETELEEARKLIDATNKEKVTLDVRVTELIDQLERQQKELEELRSFHQSDQEQIARQNQQLADLEGEISMLRRSIESLEKEKMRQSSILTRMNDEMEKLRMDLNNETINHLDAENRRQTLEEELEFQKDLHAQELKELAALAYRDTTAENREFWRNELSQAIRDIQQEYDAKCDQMRGDMEAYYNLKVQEFRTGATKQNMEVTRNKEENVKLKSNMNEVRNRLTDLEARNAQMERTNQDLMRELEEKDRQNELESSQYKEEITKLRGEMESILKELQDLMDIKLSLELEIAAYRKLLEGEETRIGMKQIVEQVVGSRTSEAEVLSTMLTKSSESSYEATGGVTSTTTQERRTMSEEKKVSSTKE